MTDLEATKFMGRMNGLVQGVSIGRVGARFTAESCCSKCELPIRVNQHLTADLKPDMGGTVRHTDCSDPYLIDNPDNQASNG